MGYELNEGTYKRINLSEDEIWKTLNWLFSSYSINETSYKFIFFKSLIDCMNMRDSNYRLSFQQVFSRFTEISWTIVEKYNVRQKAITVDKKNCVLEKILNDYSMTCLSGTYIIWDEIWEEDRVKLCKKIKTACKRYVVGALFSDMDELFYSFNKKEEWIELNPIMLEFINANKDIIENLNYYKWAKFYDKVNDKENVEKFVCLLNNGFTRKNESIYRAMLAYEFERNSFFKIEKEQLPNTIEILIVAETNATYNLDIKELSATEDEYEDEIYDSYEKMREYLKDPILLVNNMKKKRVGYII